VAEVTAEWKRGYTDEEIADAEKLYRAECDRMYEDGYSGDFGCALSFAMDTYNQICWRHFFKRDPPGLVGL
jgi:hypothetical protein